MPDKCGAETEIPATVKIRSMQAQRRLTRIGGCAYLVLCCPPPIKGDFDNGFKNGYSHCQCMMLQSCKISGFLPMRMLESDGQMQLYYDITSTITLKKFLESKAIGTDELISLLVQIFDAVKQCGGYLLDSRCIVLEPESVYIDPYYFQLKFVYIPYGNDSETEEGFRKLSLWILDNARASMENPENGNVVFKLRTVLDSGPMSISKFISEIEKFEENRADLQQSEQKQNTGLFGLNNPAKKGPDKQRIIEWPEVKTEKSINSKNERPGTSSDAAHISPWHKRKRHPNANDASMNGKEKESAGKEKERATVVRLNGREFDAKEKETTSVWDEEFGRHAAASQIRGDFPKQDAASQTCGEDDKTELLCASNKDEEEDRTTQNASKTALKTTAFLRNLSGDVTIEIQTGNNGCIIGRKKDMANCIINSKAIGKIHAEIVEREGEYYIKDLNSRNGTCVNSVRIEPGTEIKLSHRDVLTFANEDYILMISGQTSL